MTGRKLCICSVGGLFAIAAAVSVAGNALAADKGLADRPVKVRGTAPAQPERGGVLASPGSAGQTVKPGGLVGPISLELGVYSAQKQSIDPATIEVFPQVPVAAPQSGARGLTQNDLNLYDVNTVGAAGAQVFDGAGTRRAGQGYIIDPPDQSGTAYVATSLSVSLLPIASLTLDSALKATFYRDYRPPVCTTDINVNPTGTVLANLGTDKDGTCAPDVNGAVFESRRINFVTGQVFDVDFITRVVTPKGGNSGVISNTSVIAPAVAIGPGDNGMPDTALVGDDTDWTFIELEYGKLNQAGDDVVEGPTTLIPGTCIDPSTVSEDDCLDFFGLGGVGGPRVVFNGGTNACPSGDNSGGGATCPFAGTNPGFFHIDNDNNGSFNCTGEAFIFFGQTVEGVNINIRGTADSDCDNNGFVDQYDLALDPTLDDGGDCPAAVAGNGILDPCECADCNNNGVDDSTDIAGGTSQDCNSSGIPDECEIAGRDCNNNNIPDDCDIAAGTSNDCQPNFIPDECDTDTTDPDSNGFFSVDCDGFPNGASNIGDGVPDACQRAFVDCNVNGQDDFCDIAQGVSNDFDADGVPDECLNANTHNMDFEPDAVMTNFDYSLGALNKQPFPVDPGPLARFLRQWIVIDFTTVGFEVTNTGTADVIAGSLGAGTQHIRHSLVTDVGSSSVRFIFPISPILSDADTNGLQDFSGGVPTSQSTELLFQIPAGTGPSVGDFRMYFNSFADTFINTSKIRVDFRTQLGTDCNNNGLWDACDVQCSTVKNAVCNVAGCGASNDVNTNGTPDECETDCNTNGIPDLFETAQGSAVDLNGDGIPDDCQLAGNDCNNNGIPDTFEIAQGSAQDNNGNNIPDICDDCNNNGVIDGTDIAGATSVDCNNNSTPDECELVGNDFNGNSVPDDCDISTCGTLPAIPGCIDADTNNFCDNCVDVIDEVLVRTQQGLFDKPRCDEDVDSNGTPDSCQDVNADGIVDSVQLADCNLNGITDHCDINATAPSVFNPAKNCRQFWGIVNAGKKLDCNNDLVPDDCQLAGNDVDNNGVPDDCQPDCNTNGILDAIEIAAGSAEDCNNNNVPDECDTDCDNNGVVDVCDFIGTTGVPNFLDCNSNGVPDACDEDCNSNGIPDVCDIDNFGVVDCNEDCIPDSCQLANNDCNMNSIPDDCENPISKPGQVPGCLEFNPGAPVTAVVVVDVNGATATTPDTPDWTNTNGVQSLKVSITLPETLTVNFPGDTGFLNSSGEVLLNGRSLGKFRPDISNGPLLMDSMTLEWSDNLFRLGFPSDRSVESGLPTTAAVDLDDIKQTRSHEDITCADLLSTDCDANGVCDSFEINNAGADQNNNGMLDVCEGVCNDCNLNNIPDDVEIANGTATDANSNSVPDVCEPATFSTGFEMPDFDTNGGPTGGTRESIDGQQGWAVLSGSAGANFARLRQAPTASTLGFPTEGTQWLTLRDLGGGDTDSVAISPNASTVPDARIEIWCWNMTMTSNGFGRFMVELADLCLDGPLAAPTLLAGIDPNPGGGDGVDQPGEPYFDAINTGVEFRGNNQGLLNPDSVAVLSNPGGGKAYGIEALGQATQLLQVRTACLKIKNNNAPDAFVEFFWGPGLQTPPFVGDLFVTGRVETGVPTGGDRQIIFRHANEADGTAQMFVDNIQYFAKADCDRDGLDDAFYITDPVVLQDKNANGILDRCEDCNNSCTWTPTGVQNVSCLDQNRIVAAGGAVDTTDPTCGARGGSLDCNNNCIPDDCDVLMSGTGTQTGFVAANSCPGQVAPCNTFREGGGSCDADGDGTPDECQIPACPMGSNGCLDCNNNGCLDSGDISGATSNDINSNGKPDECDGDCNVNGQLDPIDIQMGISTDNNADNIPDECCTVSPKNGDFDQDSDVDSADYKFMQECEGSILGGGVGCGCADLNDDGVVDDVDVLLFERLVTGP